MSGRLRISIGSLMVCLSAGLVVAADDPSYYKPGAVWRLKAGSPTPDKNLAWHQANNLNRIGGGRITFAPAGGITCEFSYSEPPAQLVVGQRYQLSIQGNSTTHPGPPHAVGGAGLGTDARTVTSPLDGQGVHREPCCGYMVMPPPARPDLGRNLPISDTIEFLFEPGSRGTDRPFRIWAAFQADAYPSLVYEYVPFQPAGGGGPGPATPTPTPPPTTGPASPKVTATSKVCVPSDGYPELPYQPAIPGSFPEIMKTAPTEITCTVEAEVVLNAFQGNVGPVTLTVFDGLTPGLTFGKAITGQVARMHPGLGVEFAPIQLALRPQFARDTFPIKLVYTLSLNDQAEQRLPQQNCITLRFTDSATGAPLFDHPPFCADIMPLIPRVWATSYVSTSTGLPGDKKTFAVVVYNTGTIYLEHVFIDAVVPPGMTLVPDSLTPPGVAPRSPLRWLELGPIGVRGSLGVSYAATIDPGVPEGTEHIARAFVNASTPSFAGAGTRRINATANPVSVKVSAVRTGVDLSLTASAREGCPMDIVTYTATVTNTGQVNLDELQLNVIGGTNPMAGGPRFPLSLSPLRPGESATTSYRGQLGRAQRDELVDLAMVVGRPVNDGVQVAPHVQAFARASVRVLPPAISKLTPAQAPAGGSPFDLTVEGVCFVPETVVAFQPGDGVEVAPPRPPDYGFDGTTRLRRSVVLRPDARVGERSVNVVNPSRVPGGSRPYNIFTITSAGGGGPEPLLGSVWTESESGQKGTWRRRPGGNSFDAEWAPSGVRAVLEMSLTGTRVAISRRQSPDGNNCEYVGEIVGNTVSGTYHCGNTPSPIPWQATIVRDTSPPRPRLGGLTTIGCYKDDSTRDLNGFERSDPGMTPQMCVDECRRLGFAYAGTQYSTWCFCGNSFNKYGPATNCDMPCAGNPAEKCGGSWANSLYAVQ